MSTIITAYRRNLLAKDEVILNPQADYTKRLISDVPKIHEEWDLSTVELKAE